MEVGGLPGLMRGLAKCFAQPFTQPIAEASSSSSQMPAPATTADIAADKGLPRIDASNAAQFNPPGLRGLQGRTNQAKRNAPDSAPSLWYWQMTGMNWLDTKPPCSGPKYAAAQIKHSRLLEQPEQHQSGAAQ